MKISINRSRSAQLECLKLKRTLASRSAKRRVCLFFLLGIALFVLDGKSTVMEGCFSEYSLFGMFFLGFAVMLHYETHFVKSKILKNHESKNKSLSNADFYMKIEINDSSLIFETFNNYYNLNWNTTYNMFHYYKEHFFLLKNGDYYSAFVIKKNEFTSTELEEFREFLKVNMFEKK